LKRDGWKVRAVEVGGGALLAGLGRTLRFEVEGQEHYRAFRRRGEPVLFAFWHSRILPLAHLHRDDGAAVLVSEHRDGEYIARVLERSGFVTARGSSTRGGARGLRNLLRAARAGRDVAITPDGPRGPPRRVKIGAVVAARISGLPMIPVSAGGEGVWRAGSWDRFVVPRPFARIRVRYAPPIHVARDADHEELRNRARELDDVLNRLTDEVDGARPDPVRPDGPWEEPEPWPAG
jgi:lysophospholipid acyltransferase (LPLAT)-like uncharacterized protein